MSDEPKLLSPAFNFAVVQLPGRNYPGVVVQGDTLNRIVSSLARMERLLQARDYSELAGEIEILHEDLGDARSHYEKVCKRLGIDLPYPKHR